MTCCMSMFVAASSVAASHVVSCTQLGSFKQQARRRSMSHLAQRVIPTSSYHHLLGSNSQAPCTSDISVEGDAWCDQSAQNHCQPSPAASACMDIPQSCNADTAASCPPSCCHSSILFRSQGIYSGPPVEIVCFAILRV